MSESGIQILLVEDQYFARVALHTVIDATPGMRIVAETAFGSQALPLYRKHTPDVVIMDLRLPGLSGFSAIRAIRDEFPQARIVVLSNYEGSEDVHRALEAGALGYLTKNSEAGELIAAITAVSRGNRFLPRQVTGILSSRMAFDELTAREAEVLELITRGMSNKEIGVALGIAEKTVRIHMTHILSKLGVEDRTQAALAAIQRGIVHLD